MQFIKTSIMHRETMITTLDGYLQLPQFYYRAGKKKDKRWIAEKNVEPEWEIIITAYSKRYVQKNEDLFQKLLQKIGRKENEESLE